MNKRLFATLIGILLSVNFALASDSKPQCPDIPLLQNASAEEIERSMIKPQHTPFLSKDYCLVLFGPTFHHLTDNFYSIYNTKQRRNVARNYHWTYKGIEDINQRFIFVHFFLREMSHKMTLTGITEDLRMIGIAGGNKEEAGVLVRSKGKSPNKQHWVLLVLSEELEVEDFMQALDKAQQGNPQPEDYPAMMTLVERVMDGEHRMSKDEINTLIQRL